ncbi:MAG: glycosyltransferase [Pirellulales bacterium]
MIVEATGYPVPTPRPLRIALVVTSKIWGGSESQAALLAGELRRQGHDCRFFARWGGRVARAMRRDRFRVHAFVGTGRDPWSIWQMRRAFVRWRPDVLHLNDTHAISSGGLAAWRLPISARVAMRRCVHPLRHVDRYLRFADRVICVAAAVADQCRLAGIGNDRLRIIHDGVAPERHGAPDHDIRRAVRRQLSVGAAQPLLLTAAQLQPMKGHRYLVDAIHRLVPRYPNVVALLAGAGPGRKALEQQIRQLGIGRNVRFVGFRHDVPRLLKAADLFVMPSLSEGLCSALIEAMAAGCPVVTTRVGGIAELVPAGEDRWPLAWAVPPHDPASLTRAIGSALGAPHDRAIRAERARRRAIEYFTADRMVRQTLAVYHELLGQPERSVEHCSNLESEKCACPLRLPRCDSAFHGRGTGQASQAASWS